MVVAARRQAQRSPLGPWAVERCVVAIRVAGRSILAIALEQIAVPRLGSSRARCSRPSGQIGEAGEVGGSGVRGTSSALFGLEQTVGIDLSLERRPERLPGCLGRLARVVGRVESVCTDPAAKGPTGPFCLVHLRIRPVLPWRCPAVRLWLLPCWEAPSLDRRDVARLALASCLAAPGAEFRRRSENGLTVRSYQLGRKTLCT